MTRHPMIPGVRPAFTLVELLVVVAILGILIGVLLPSLSSARQSSYAVKCASNLKQLGTGWTIYAQNNDDSMVAGRMAALTHPNASNPNRHNIYSAGNGDQYRPRWFVQIGAEAGFFAYDQPSTNPADDNTKAVDSELFVCTARPDWVNNRNLSYGYNYQFLGNGRLFAGSSNVIGEANFINWPVKMSFLSHVGGTVVAADNLGTAATFPRSGRLPYNVDGLGSDLRELGNHGWSLDPPRLTSNGDFCDDGNRCVARSGPDPRHQDRANFLFGDTHVEPLLPRDVGYQPLDDGSYPMPGDPYNDDRSENSKFSGTGKDDAPPSRGSTCS